mmetsp:Transcript_48422/g.142925  ORF Transcript_48422/g.142925 Transcript_48422/m.142925 type:complete len:223 (-) Transcript_48422:860-1528(-)
MATLLSSRTRTRKTFSTLGEGVSKGTRTSSDMRTDSPGGNTTTSSNCCVALDSERLPSGFAKVRRSSCRGLQTGRSGLASASPGAGSPQHPVRTGSTLVHSGMSGPRSTFVTGQKSSNVRGAARWMWPPHRSAYLICSARKMGTRAPALEAYATLASMGTTGKVSRSSFMPHAWGPLRERERTYQLLVLGVSAGVFAISRIVTGMKSFVTPPSVVIMMAPLR